jgi:flagellar biosynthesis/type III secretory pathway protein FliH
LTSFATATRDSDLNKVEVFQYPIAPGAPELSSPAIWASSSASGEEKPRAVGASSQVIDGQSALDLQQRIANEGQRAFAAGHEAGLREGRQREREEQAAALKSAEQRRMQQATELGSSFAQARAQYLGAIEQEVVKLALAVAARILRREAQMDPLLLTGAVRVALGQLAASTSVLLKVPPDEFELWQETMAHLPGKIEKPTVVAGEGMKPGDCRVETAVGSVDLGLRAQLAEIERGFFDRAGRTPGPAFSSHESPTPGPGKIEDLS